MRTYPQDSPRAAARIVVMASLADGHLCSSEVERLERLGVATTLGLQPQEWQSVVQEYCEDRLIGVPHGWSALPPDAATMDAILDEVRDPALRLTIMRLCTSVANADAHGAEGESVMTQAAAARWGLTPADLQAA